MRRRRWKGSGIGRLTRVGIVMTCVAAIGACSSSDETTTTTAVRREGSVAESVGTEWPVYGHDYANTRLNASEKEIDRTTVARLTEDWSKDGLIGVSGTPVVSGGVAYFGDWAGKVWAVKADTGAEMWSVPVGGMVVGAPAVDGDAVYASSGRTLYRLDRARLT